MCSCQHVSVEYALNRDFHRWTLLLHLHLELQDRLHFFATQSGEVEFLWHHIWSPHCLQHEQTDGSLPVPCLEIPPTRLWMHAALINRFMLPRVQQQTVKSLASLLLRMQCTFCVLCIVFEECVQRELFTKIEWFLL